jgi:hypothetical protein
MSIITIASGSTYLSIPPGSVLEIGVQMEF